MKRLILILLSFLFITPADAGQLRILSPFISPAPGAIGYSTPTGNYQLLYVNYVYHSDFITTTSGTVGYGHAYVNNDGTSIALCIGLYDGVGNLLLYGSQVISHSGLAWVNIQMNTTTNLTDATHYYLGMQTNTTFSAGYGFDYMASGGLGMYYDNIGSYTCDQDPINGKETTVDADGRYVIYFDNQSGDPS